MASFLSKNKVHGLRVLTSSLVGQVGYSITKESIRDLSGSLFSFALENDVKLFTVAYGNNSWAKSFAIDLIKNLNKTGFVVVTPDKPATLSELSWLVTQGKDKRLGVYLSNSVFTQDRLKIDLINSDGKRFTDKQFNKLLKAQASFTANELKDSHNIEYQQSVDISLYPKYLKDKNLVKDIFSSNIHIDCMFGPTEYLVKNFKKEVQGTFRTFNLESEPPRLNNYRGNPTGAFLKWGAISGGFGPNDLFFAFDGAGERFGIFDVKQNTELSVDSVCMILLKSLKKSKGSVVISTLFSSAVKKLAKSLGFEVIISDKQLQDFPDPIAFYADGLGNFVFQGFTVPDPLSIISAVATVCATENKSPGEIIDSLTKKSTPKCVAMAVYKPEVYLAAMAKSMGGKPSQRNGVIVNKNNSGWRTLFKFDKLQNIGIVKIESNNDAELKVGRSWCENYFAETAHHYTEYEE